MRSLSLDPRLSLVYEMVQPCQAAADIGCDHGRMAVSLVLTGKAKTCYACDINEKPLDKARRLARDHKISDHVISVCTSGLEGLEAAGITECVIAGMGGELIAALLSAAPWAHNSRLHFVLQPATRPERLRRYLYENGFSLASEHGVMAAGRLYTVLSVRYTGEVVSPSPAMLYAGALPDSPYAASVLYVKRLAGRYHKLGIHLQGKDPEKAESYSRLAADLQRLISR